MVSVKARALISSGESRQEMGGGDGLSGYSSSYGVIPETLDNIPTNLVWRLTRHHQGMIMPISTPERGLRTVPRGLRACGRQLQKSKPQIY